MTVHKYGKSGKTDDGIHYIILINPEGGLLEIIKFERLVTKTDRNGVIVEFDADSCLLFICAIRNRWHEGDLPVIPPFEEELVFRSDISRGIQLEAFKNPRKVGNVVRTVPAHLHVSIARDGTLLASTINVLSRTRMPSVYANAMVKSLPSNIL